MVDVGAWLGSWWGCDWGQSLEHEGRRPCTKEMPRPSPLTQSQMHYCIFPQTASIQRSIWSEIIRGDNLPALLLSKLTSSDPPYLQGPKALSPLCFYTEINYRGCPVDKIHSFLSAFCWLWKREWEVNSVTFFGVSHPTISPEFPALFTAKPSKK